MLVTIPDRAPNTSVPANPIAAPIGTLSPNRNRLPANDHGAPRTAIPRTSTPSRQMLPFVIRQLRFNAFSGPGPSSAIAIGPSDQRKSV